jgi:hypothetical protein
VTIDAYLAELERLLPRAARLRALPEVREHLRDAAAHRRAAGDGPFEAEETATRAFGLPAVVGPRLAGELAVRETRIAAALAIGAVALFVFPLYVVPENTLPPASWAEMPSDLLALQRVALGLWVLAGALAVASAVLAWTHWRRYAASALLFTTVALAGSIAASVALVARWFALTPATPGWGFAAPPAAACLVVCVCAAAWARCSRQRLLVHD